MRRHLRYTSAPDGTRIAWTAFRALVTAGVASEYARAARAKGGAR